MFWCTLPREILMAFYVGMEWHQHRSKWVARPLWLLASVLVLDVSHDCFLFGPALKWEQVPLSIYLLSLFSLVSPFLYTWVASRCHPGPCSSLQVVHVEEH